MAGRVRLDVNPPCVCRSGYPAASPMEGDVALVTILLLGCRLAGGRRSSISFPLTTRTEAGRVSVELHVPVFGEADR